MNVIQTYIHYYYYFPALSIQVLTGTMERGAKGKSAFRLLLGKQT